MSGKNLTFKLIMDGDSKGLIAAAKQSESVTKKVFESIKTEADQLKQSSAAAALALGNIVPEKSKELADGLTKSLSGATQIIRDAGDNAKSAASNFTDFGNKSVKALAFLKSDLEKAKIRLEAFSKTKATPADIEIAQKQVDQLENEVQQAESAFIDFHTEVGKANSSLNSTETAAQAAQSGLNSAKFAANALASAMAALGVGLGVQELSQVADAYTNLSARINIATKEGGDFKSAMAGVHQVALMTNSSLSATGDLFTRLNAVGKDLGMTQQSSLDLTKTINQAIQISGVSAQASEAFTQQFIQSMQQGTLRGEEYNSMMENGFGVAEALAKGLGVTTGELKNMADSGELGAERVYKALLSQKDSVQQTFDQFPTTIGNALQRISTSWEILIGKMDQSNGASATVADWLVTIASNMDVVETLLNDIGEGFIWVGDQFKRIDTTTIIALKIALTSIYDAIKTLGETLGEAFVITLDVLNDVLSGLYDFNNGIDEANSKTNGFTKVLQTFNVAIGFVSDGFKGIQIAANLFVGIIYDLAAAWVQLVSKFTWGDVKQQAIADMDAMATKAQEYYKKASDGALEFKSKGVQALDEIGKTQDQKNAESLAQSKATLDQMLANQQSELNGKKITEDEKLKAVTAYAEAAIAANKGVMDGMMQADLIAKGYMVTMDQAGKVSVQAFSQATDGANNTGKALVQARKGAEALGVDLDIALNRVSEKFAANQNHLTNYANGLDELGLKGEQAVNALYMGWEKWLASAKSEVEIEAAKAKLQSFGEQGKLSTSQVEMGMQAVKRAVQEIPDSLTPVEAAFERLGIKTKEQLKLAADLALNDFNTILKSGEATQDGLQQAYEETIRLAYASGDAQVIAAANAKAAYLGLEVQLDATGKATVTKLGEIQQAAIETRRTVSQVSQSTAREQPEISAEQQATNDHWEDFKAKMKARTDELNAKSQARSSGGGVGSLLSNNSDSAQQIPSMPDAPMIATSFDIQGIENMQPTEKKVLELQSGGKAAELQGTPEAVDSVEEMLREFEMLKRSM
ncbi:tape measure protein [Acinetobacter johnsonii]|uniref:tape measure protein n=1 Tax=Acinetobacter johnsonii TaxID=40214 RepID=UPI001321AF83|nr:tape measure protein [Acinetobacter johnsonii]MDH1727551.1 tape measure protein [Acinetobacter johnsonii]MWC19664.1 tape measure protein [Acinetobacter johnsonii]